MSDRAYESTDIEAARIWWFAFSLAASLLVISLLVFAYFHLLQAGHTPSRRSDFPTVSVPPPVLQISPRTDLAEDRQLNARRLHEYQWIDRDAGLIRLPIDRAIDLTLERGLPARQP